MDTVYTECANGIREYWVYSDGRKVYVSEKWVQRAMARRTARMVEVN